MVKTNTIKDTPNGGENPEKINEGSTDKENEMMDIKERNKENEGGKGVADSGDWHLVKKSGKKKKETDNNQQKTKI